MDKPQDQGDNRSQQDSWKQQQQQQSGDRQQQQGGMGQSGQQGDMRQQGDSRQQQQFDTQGRGQQGGGGSMETSRFASQIREDMEVIDADGQHVGTVDKIEGDQIKLTKSDPGMGGSSSGQHRYLQLSQVEGIEGGRVRLSSRGDTSGFGSSADR